MKSLPQTIPPMSRIIPAAVAATAFLKLHHLAPRTVAVAGILGCNCHRCFHHGKRRVVRNPVWILAACGSTSVGALVSTTH
jgi:hypothetical protein